MANCKHCRKELQPIDSNSCYQDTCLDCDDKMYDARLMAAEDRARREEYGD